MLFVHESYTTKKDRKDENTGDIYYNVFNVEGAKIAVIVSTEVTSSRGTRGRSYKTKPQREYKIHEIGGVEQGFTRISYETKDAVLYAVSRQ